MKEKVFLLFKEQMKSDEKEFSYYHMTMMFEDLVPLVSVTSVSFAQDKNITPEHFYIIQPSICLFY